MRSSVSVVSDTVAPRRGARRHGGPVTKARAEHDKHRRKGGATRICCCSGGATCCGGVLPVIICHRKRPNSCQERARSDSTRAASGRPSPARMSRARCVEADPGSGMSYVNRTWKAKSMESTESEEHGSPEPPNSLTENLGSGVFPTRSLRRRHHRLTFIDACVRPRATIPGSMPM